MFWIGALVAVIVTVFIAFMYFSYIDKTVTEGALLGFEIGSTKAEVLATVKKIYKNKGLSLGHNIYDENDIRNELLDLEKDAPLFYEKDKWRFYFGYRNFVAFYFSNNSLVEIYRHRQYFEFP